MSTIKEKYASNIIGYWDFRRGSLLDQSGNGFTAVAVGTPSWGRDKFGRSVAIENNTSGLTLGKILGTTAAVSNMTIVVQMQLKSMAGSYTRIVKKFAGGGSQAGSLDLDIPNTGRIRFLLANSLSAFTVLQTGGGEVTNGTPLIIAATFTGATKAMVIYKNGVSVATGAFTDSTIPAYDFNWETGPEGTNTGKNDYNQILVFNTALTGAEVAQLYEEIDQEGNYDVIDITHLDNTYDAYDATGADSLPVYITDGQGWNESFANETAGQLSNTGFRISTGTWQVDSLGLSKYINTIGAGIISKKNTQAYGTWEFDFNKTAAGAINVIMIAKEIGSATATGQNGYLLMLTSAENVQLWITTNGVVGAQLMSSSNSAFTASAWHTFKMTRSPTGEFSLYIDGVLLDAALGGTNPVTENTHTTSAYINIDPDAGDLIRNFVFKPYVI